jgi:surface protein
MASIKYNNKTLREALKDYFKNPSTIELNTWDTSEVTNMSSLFIFYNNFNQPLNNWNVSNVTNMGHMFEGCEKFNQPLDQWNTSNVTNMGSMFSYCKEFNQPLDRWNTSNVTNMGDMFGLCKKFNQPLDQWNVSKVSTMSGMFSGCKEFNQPLEQWNVSRVTNMGNMFKYCENFNQPLNLWNILRVTDMNSMFFNCEKFNQPLDRWNTANVTNMHDIFYRCGPIAQNNIQLWERERERANPQVRVIPPPTQGVAYEIHNAFNQHYALNKDKYFEIIKLPGHPDSIYTSINIVEYIKPKLLELIQRVYPADAINVKTEEMNQILTTINNASELSEKPDTKLLLGKTVDFLVTQSNEFVHFYLEALKYDCLNAYSSGSPISCVKGMIERFYLTIGDTAYTLCPDPDTCNNPKYNELVSLFNKRVDKNELTQEWNKTFLEDPIKKSELLKLNKDQRKDHYRQFMIQKYRDAGQIPTEKAKQIVLRDIIEPEIVKLDYVFDELQFGGIRRNKSKKNKSKKNKSKKNKSKKNKSKKNKSRKNKSRKNKSRKNKSKKNKSIK